MLKERITELMNRYEGCDEWLTAGDVQKELEDILDDEEYDDELSPKLYDAVSKYILAQHYAERGGGRIPDGSDEFIKDVKHIIGYES